ncbi:autoinducer 2 ABC transporter substrate-binding protein [Egibacter rhizosphaerae]|uniref:Autoinducer 2-binding protein LsrB n=2 Tax=Egibacter rhizosphaerae TaxID=1670831 RepID=A0A411YLG6_9ACTN|nr:autoinducer 2 ABC transporter substrate-binding protein [Egibacter rhizosphaerae]
MLPKLVGIPYFNASEEGAQEAADELGVTLEFDGPTEDSTADQVELIEQWTGSGDCDAITVSANDPDALAPAMEAAQEEGIATGSWDADVVEEAREFFVNQVDPEALGAQLVDTMAEQTGGAGEFLIVTGSLTAPNQNEWMEAMSTHMEEEYPDMTVASVQPGEEDLELGVEVTESYLQANPDTAGVFGITSVALPGAADAVDQLGLSGEVAVTGLGVPSEVSPYVETGTVEEWVLWDPVDLGYLAVQVAVAQVTGDMPDEGTFDAARIGEVDIVEETGEVLLGPPTVFDESNMGDYDF